MTSDDLRAGTDAASSKAGASVRAAKDRAATETSHALHDADRDLDAAAARGGDAAAGLYGRAKDRVRETARGLSDRLPADAVESGRRAYVQGSATVGRRVAKQPIEAVLLAGALGYLLGWATGRG